MLSCTYFQPLQLRLCEKTCKLRQRDKEAQDEAAKEAKSQKRQKKQS
jgi:hypothetical protein